MVWGGVELFENTPTDSDLYNSNLWKFGLATFVIQLVVILIIVLIPLICLCLPKKKEPEQLSSVFVKDGKLMVSNSPVSTSSPKRDTLITSSESAFTKAGDEQV